MSNSPNFLDLDAIVPESVGIRLNGKEHKLSPLSVGDFITNAQMVQRFKVGSVTIEDELDIVMEVLLRAFPTVTKEELLKLSISQVDALTNFVQDFNARRQKKMEDKVAEDTGNPPTAS